MAVGIIVMLWTAIAAPILAIAAVSFSDDRAALDAYDAAPMCVAGAATESTCKQEVEYHVSGEYGHAGQNSVWYLYLTDSSGAQTRLQLAEPTGVWPAVESEPVTVTSWRGSEISVSDGRNVSNVVGSPALQRGDGAYTVLWFVGAIYVFLVLLTFIPRLAGRLLLVPVAMVITGIALHGRIVGGPWAADFLFYIAAGLGLLFLIALIPKRGKARRAGSA